MTDALIPAPPALTPAWLAARLSDPARLARAFAPRGDEVERPLPDDHRPQIPAAVLVPLVLHPEPTVLLTLRAARLSSHAGQVSFPGGRIEPGETPEQAAVREAAEEVGLDPRLPQIQARLPDYVTGTGYRVTPVVALLPPPLRLTPDPAEVELAFELPLVTVLDPMAPQRRSREYRGRLREFWVWPHPDHYIWGATAAMLVSLARVLRD